MDDDSVCGGKYEFEWITYTLWYVIIVIKSVPQAVTNPLEVYRLRKSSVGVMSLREMYALHGEHKHTLYIRDMRNTKRIALRIVFFLWNTVMYAQCTCVGEWEWCSICEHKFGP